MISYWPNTGIYLVHWPWFSMAKSCFRGSIHELYGPMNHRKMGEFSSEPLKSLIIASWNDKKKHCIKINAHFVWKSRLVDLLGKKVVVNTAGYGWY